MSKITEMFQRAEAGELQAQLSLAMRYFKGNGIKKSPEQAIRFWKMAAEQGAAAAAVALSDIYRFGDGVPSDDGQAIAWAERAIALGDVASHATLGSLYLFANDLAGAHRHLAIAAEHGDTGAMVQLADMFERGAGAPSDAARARDLLERAAEGGNAMAMRQLAPSLGAHDPLKAYRYVGMSMQVEDWNRQAPPLPELEARLTMEERIAANQEIHRYHASRGHLDYSQPIH